MRASHSVTRWRLGDLRSEVARAYDLGELTADGDIGDRAFGADEPALGGEQRLESIDVTQELCFDPARLHAVRDLAR